MLRTPRVVTRPQGGRHVECLGKKAQRAAIFQEELCMAILRGLKDQLLTDRRLRSGESSIVDKEGVMIDGNEEIEDYYAGLFENNATAFPRDTARFKSAAQNRGAACFGPNICQSQDYFDVAPRYNSSD